MMKKSLPAIIRKTNWDRLVLDGKIPETLPAVVNRSWCRCRKMGLDPNGPNLPYVLPEEEFARLCLRNHDLLQIFRNHLPSFSPLAKEIHLGILLLDKDGTILFREGSDPLLKVIDESKIREGANLGEETIGTTAPGICIIDKVPALITGEEHYSKLYHRGNCLAAPIFSERDCLQGCLNLTTFYSPKAEGLNPFIFQTLLSVVRLIHADIRLHRLLQDLQLQECTLDSLEDGIIFLDVKGHVTHANRSCFDLLGETPEELLTAHYSTVFPTLSERDLKRRHEIYIKPNFSLRDTSYQIQINPVSKEGEKIGTVLILKQEGKKNFIPKSNVTPRPFRHGEHIGQSSAFKQTIDFAKTAARSNANILLEGETGTGKDLLAHFIHHESSRREGPFIPINCAAIPKDLAESEFFGHEKGAFTGARQTGQQGKFELAHRGTLFLDEVNSLLPSIQAKLLRVIESHEFMRVGGIDLHPIDVRIIAASTVSLKEKCLHGEFMTTLFYRLNTFTIPLPPLRVRKKDIQVLSEYFLKKLSAEYNKSVTAVDPSAVELLLSYQWPGNIRELRNVIHFAVTMTKGNSITPYDLPQEILLASRCEKSFGGLKNECQAMENEILLKRIREVQGNMTRAASILDISRSTLYRKIKKLNLESYK